MAKHFLTQKEKIHLRTLKNRGQKLTKEARENMFEKTYNPKFDYKTNQVKNK